MRPHGWRESIACVLVSAAVLVIVGSHSLNRYWVGDFWAHVAVVRELMRRPNDPFHPLLAVDAPHPLFTPYAWLVAGLASALALRPATALAIVGVVNIVLLLAGIRMACRSLTKRRSEVFTVLAALLLWGRDPWQFSGFLHLSAIGFAAAYPSTFALALALMCIAVLAKAPLRAAVCLAVVGACGIILITHPAAALFLYVGIAALVIDAFAKRQLMAVAQLIAIIPLSLAIAAAWPLYPFIRFSLYEAPQFASFNAPMYDELLTRAAPALCAVPLILARLWRSPTDPLALWFVGTVAIYAVGWLTENWGLGRILPFGLLLLHMAIGDWLARFAETRWSSLSRAGRRFALILGVSIGLAGTVNLAGGIVRAIPRSLLPDVLANDRRLIRPLATYEVLDGLIRDEAVVLTRHDAGYVVAAQGAKVVALEIIQAFVDDQEERRRAVAHFLSCDASDDIRRETVRRYRVEYVVIDKLADPPCLTAAAALDHLGTIVLETDRLMLVKVE